MPEHVSQKKEIGCLPYAAGGASFIPFLGVPFGIVAIVIGVIKRKVGGWTLIVMGSLGILFTVGLYGTLFYQGFVKRGGIYDELRGELTKNSLATLVKEIEFYKLNKGSYPDALTALETDPSKGFVTIYDTSSVKLGTTEPKLFHYEKVDENRYYLWSDGIDGIPDTADDVFPSVDTSENIGYKRKAIPQEDPIVKTFVDEAEAQAAQSDANRSENNQQ